MRLRLIPGAADGGPEHEACNVGGADAVAGAEADEPRVVRPPMTVGY